MKTKRNHFNTAFIFTILRFSQLFTFFTATLLLNQIKANCQVCAPDTLTLPYIQTHFFDIRGKSIPKNIYKNVEDTWVLYNSRNCSQCFFEIKKKRREHLYLLVLQPTNPMAQYLMVKKFHSHYTGIYFIHTQDKNTIIPLQIAAVQNNQMQTPCVLNYNKSLGTFHFIPFDSLFNK